MDVDQMMITLLNMSITAGFAALLVMALRLLYKRLPKRFSCVLWLVVIFRFLCPFSLLTACCHFIRIPWRSRSSIKTRPPLIRGSSL